MFGRGYLIALCVAVATAYCKTRRTRRGFVLLRFITLYTHQRPHDIDRHGRQRVDAVVDAAKAISAPIVAKAEATAAAAVRTKLCLMRLLLISIHRRRRPTSRRARRRRPNARALARR
jgi:hypothetical protein